MQTQKNQLVNNLTFKQSSAKHINIVRVLFHKEFTKIDFSYNSNKIIYIKGTQILINPEIYIETKFTTYDLLSTDIFKKAFFKTDKDIKYFSLLFETIDEDLDCFDIVDPYLNKELFKFNFTDICIPTKNLVSQ